MFDKIISIALNPALDITLHVDGLSSEHINTVLHEETDAAGKATNVSRVLKSFGVENIAVILAGRENSDNYFRILGSAPENERISWKAVYNSGLIRENLHIILKDGSLVTVRRKGFTIEKKALDEIFSIVEDSVDSGTLITLCGRLPDGMSGSEFRKLCELIHKKHGSIVIDSNSITLDDIVAARPWLIKPNLEELEQYTGKKYDSYDAMCTELSNLNNAGVENIILSLGGDGLIFSCADKCFKADVPHVKALSPVGAGDSTLSGFIVGTVRGLALPDRVRLAASFGTASVLLAGTKPPRREDVEDIFQNVTVHQI